MKHIIKNFLLYEDSDFNLEDRDVELSNKDIENLDKMDKSAEADKSNENEYDNLYDAVEELVSGENSKEDTINKIKSDGIDSANLVGFTNENDIYDFYLKYKLEIDERLDDVDFFDDAPVKYGSKSLYDYTIQGTKIAVESLINDM